VTNKLFLNALFFGDKMDWKEVEVGCGKFGSQEFGCGCLESR